MCIQRKTQFQNTYVENENDKDGDDTQQQERQN